MIVSYKEYTGELVRLEISHYEYVHADRSAIIERPMRPCYRVEIMVDEYQGFKVTFDNVDITKLEFLDK